MRGGPDGARRESPTLPSAASGPAGGLSIARASAAAPGRTRGAERDENTCRKPFTPSESVALGKRIEPLEHKRAKERQVVAGKICGRGKIGSANLAEAIPGIRARDRVSEAVGMKRTTYSRAKAGADQGATSGPAAPRGT